MKTVIYCFSGRGNSLKTAMDLSDRLDGSAIVPVRHDSDGKIDSDVERIGFVTSVVDIGIPAMVLKFIDRLAYRGKKPYVFAVVTNGGMPGASLDQLKKRLRRKGLGLSSGFLVKFGLEKENNGAWERRINEISDIVKLKQRHEIVTPFRDKLMTAIGNNLAKLMIPKEDKKFQVSDACNGCGICEKVCPAGNIDISAGKPVWRHSCEQCAACFAWCPREAVTGTNLAAKTRFRNPDVKLDRMLSCINGGQGRRKGVGTHEKRTRSMMPYFCSPPADSEPADQT